MFFAKKIILLLLLTSVARASLDSDQLDTVVVAYNSYDSRDETLVFASIDENVSPTDTISTLNAGMGQHLWKVDEHGPELKRGWMFRLRLTIQAVIDEYNRRGKQDFIAVVSDAADVYVSKSASHDTISELKHRFLSQFSKSKIVFSTQVFCCNPWELRSVGRADWDRLYENNEPLSIYKHLNAGLYIGYASAIIDMAEEMQLWDKDYHRHEGFHSLMGTDAAKYLTMKDMEVDDDEWQLAAWFFEDQAKSSPLAALDFQQDLFAVTGTFRAQENDDGYHIFSRNHFMRMFGPFPSSFPNPEGSLDKLTVCPYVYDSDLEQWSNTITGAQPLMFHFAGNDWLCACQVFEAEGFAGVTGKFRKNCRKNKAVWDKRVKNAILQIARSEDPEEELFLYKTGLTTSVHKNAVSVVKSASVALRQRRQEEEDGEGPYGDGRRLDDEGPYGDDRRLDDKGPYGDDRRLDDEGPYGDDRRLDEGPYGDGRRLDGDDDEGPYNRRHLVDAGAYGRRLDEDDDEGPYGRRHLKEDDEDEGPYDRRIFRRRLVPDDDEDDDEGPYGRRA